MKSGAWGAWSRIAFALLALLLPASAWAAPGGYSYYEIGDRSAKTPAPTAPALMLVGGGDWDYRAFRWFAERAGHGHIVVLRASGEGEAGEEIFNQVGGVASVQTLVFRSRVAASDARVLDILARADGIFIAGGDQANYVRFWKEPPSPVRSTPMSARGARSAAPAPASRSWAAPPMARWTAAASTARKRSPTPPAPPSRW